MTLHNKRSVVLSSQGNKTSRPNQNLVYIYSTAFQISITGLLLVLCGSKGCLFAANDLLVQDTEQSEIFILHEDEES